MAGARRRREETIPDSPAAALPHLHPEGGARGIRCGYGSSHYRVVLPSSRPVRNAIPRALAGRIEAIFALEPIFFRRKWRKFPKMYYLCTTQTDNGAYRCPGGGIGRRARFRCVCRKACRFDSCPGHQRSPSENSGGDSSLFDESAGRNSANTQENQIFPSFVLQLCRKIVSLHSSVGPMLPQPCGAQPDVHEPTRNLTL